MHLKKIVHIFTGIFFTPPPGPIPAHFRIEELSWNRLATMIYFSQSMPHCLLLLLSVNHHKIQN